MTLEAAFGTKLKLTAEGDDAKEMLDKLEFEPQLQELN